MKIKYLCIVCLTATLFISGCEKTIRFKGEIIHPKLVVNSFITPDSVLKAEVTASRFFLDEGSQGYGGYEYDKVTNADFRLYVNDAFREKLTHAGGGIYRSAYLPKPGDEIRIETAATGFEPVTASTIIPPRPVILKTDTSSVAEKQYYIGYKGEYNGNSKQDTLSEVIVRKYSFQVRFKDDGSKKNYYRLVVIKRNYFEDFITDEYLTRFDDIVFGNKQTGGVGDLFDFSESSYHYDTFTDDLLNGKEYSLKFSAYAGMGYNDYYGFEYEKIKEIRTTFFIYLQEISYEYYMYALSSAKAGNQDDNPFVEPVQIYSNIVNGIGVLGSYTSSVPAVIDTWNK